MCINICTSQGMYDYYHCYVIEQAAVKLITLILCTRIYTIFANHFFKLCFIFINVLSYK